MHAADTPVRGVMLISRTRPGCLWFDIRRASVKDEQPMAGRGLSGGCRCCCGPPSAGAVRFTATLPPREHRAVSRLRIRPHVHCAYAYKQLNSHGVLAAIHTPEKSTQGIVIRISGRLTPPCHLPWRLQTLTSAPAPPHPPRPTTSSAWSGETGLDPYTPSTANFPTLRPASAKAARQACGPHSENIEITLSTAVTLCRSGCPFAVTANYARASDTFFIVS